MRPEIKTRLAQIRAGEIPQGYKKTKLGIIPQEWEVMPLKSRFDRLTRKNSENNTNVMTISAQYGLINQEEFFKKEIASEDKSNYYLLHNGEFAYNKSYSSGYPFGAIKRLSLYDKGIVSPLYICFSANNHNPCPEFYQHYFEGGKLNSEIQAIAQEGARNHGLLNISVEDFFYTKIIVPPLEEQKKIADILSAQGRIIELCERKTEQLKRMKKYYLQKMFPKDGEEYPEIRFKGFTDAWEQRKFNNTFDVLQNNALSRADLSDEQGSVMNVHYGDILVRFGEVLDVSSEKIPYLVDDAIAKKYSSSELQNGDIIIADAAEDETVGKCTEIANLQGEKVLAGLHTIPVRARLEFSCGYLGYYLNSNSYHDQLLPLMQGTKVSSISKSAIQDTLIIFPKSAEEQQRIGDYFRNLDHLITLHQRKCEEEKKKKKALQQLLLTGIVRVKE